MLAEIIAAAAASAQPLKPGAAARGRHDDPAAEIIVTGERARRTLKHTASSVDVITGGELQAQPVDRVEQVLQSVPNVQVGHGSEGPAIRGLDTTGALQALPAFLGGNRPRTTIIVDGRAQTYSEFVFGAEPTWDVERIEVFRSPQTTTQGQNSIAGAIFVYTDDPSFEPEYAARAIVGDFKTRQVSAVASAPLNADVAVRVAGDLRYSRTTSRIADRVEGADPNHDVYGTLRAKLLVEPDALRGTRLLLTYAHNQSQAPQVVQLTAPFRERQDQSGFYGTFRINVDSVTAAVRQETGDVTANLLLTAGDSSALRLAFPGLGRARNDGRDWSGEAVVKWSPPGSVTVAGGLSRQHIALRQVIDLSALSGVGHFRDWQDGTGLFGEATVRLGQRTTFTAGLRYQRDRQKRAGGLDSRDGSTIALDYDRTFDALLPKLSLAYELSSATTAGVLVERAYNPGGTTLRFDVGQPDNFAAERLWDYEAFFRSATAGGRLTIGGNLFYYDIRNAQRARGILVLSPRGSPVGFADLFNAPRAHSYGAEAQVEWRPRQTLSGQVSLGLLRSKLDDAGPDYPEFTGKEFSRSPHMTASAAVTWKPVAGLMLSAQARHHSAYFGDDVNGPAVRVHGSTIANARAEYRFGRVAAFAYARNLFDKFALVDRLGDLAAVAEDPREIGLGIEARF